MKALTNQFTQAADPNDGIVLSQYERAQGIWETYPEKFTTEIHEGVTVYKPIDPHDPEVGHIEFIVPDNFNKPGAVFAEIRMAEPDPEGRYDLMAFRNLDDPDFPAVYMDILRMETGAEAGDYGRRIYASGDGMAYLDALNKDNIERINPPSVERAFENLGYGRAFRAEMEDYQLFLKTKENDPVHRLIEDVENAPILPVDTPFNLLEPSFEYEDPFDLMIDSHEVEARGGIRVRLAEPKSVLEQQGLAGVFNYRSRSLCLDGGKFGPADLAMFHDNDAFILMEQMGCENEILTSPVTREQVLTFKCKF